MICCILGAILAGNLALAARLAWPRLARPLFGGRPLGGLGPRGRAAALVLPFVAALALAGLVAARPAGEGARLAAGSFLPACLAPRAHGD
ncbi:MAG: hypothetical protein H6923_02810 [Alphaproteobacteria bacterium]|nr:hypothetical protein [Alphaproteobacteria bacterium]